MTKLLKRQLLLFFPCYIPMSETTSISVSKAERMLKMPKKNLRAVVDNKLS